MPHDAATHQPWDAALDSFRGITNAAAQFNVELLEQLRPRWNVGVRPDTSMFRVLFTRYGATGHEFDERVEVLYETPDRVRVAFVRLVPRRGETRPAGRVVVAGDLVRPENAGPVVESFLMQLSHT